MSKQQQQPGHQPGLKSELEETTLQIRERPLSINESLEFLKPIGSFKFIETTIEGLHSMNPQKGVTKNNYLIDEDIIQERKDLLQRLELWAGLIDESASTDEMQSKAMASCERYGELVKKIKPL